MQQRTCPAIDQRSQYPCAGIQFETDHQFLPLMSQLENMLHRKKEGLPDPIEIIKKIMQQRGLTNNDLRPYLGSSGNVCDILKKRRPLSLAMIRKLHAGLGIPAHILIQEYHR